MNNAAENAMNFMKKNWKAIVMSLLVVAIIIMAFVMMSGDDTVAAAEGLRSGTNNLITGNNMPLWWHGGRHAGSSLDATGTMLARDGAPPRRHDGMSTWVEPPTVAPTMMAESMSNLMDPMEMIRSAEEGKSLMRQE